MRTPGLFALLTVLCAALWIPSPALVVVETAPEGAPVQLTEQRTSVTIDHPTARTTVVQTYRNTLSRDLEGTLIIPLPADAHLADFVLTADGKRLPAETLSADEARRIYQKIVARRKDPALLEYIDSKTIRASIYPIPANGEISVEFQYLQTIRKEGGLFNYTFVPPGTPRFGEGLKTSLSIALNAPAKIGTLISPTHEAQIKRDGDHRKAELDVPVEANPAAPVTLLYDLAASETGVYLLPHRFTGDKKGHFLLTISPPREGILAKRIPRDILFVVDVSGSMAGPGKIDRAQASMVQCLAGLDKDDRFGMMAFSTSVDSYRPQLVAATDENIAAAQDWVKELRARGGTNIHDALMQAREMLAEADNSGSRLQQVLFFTDGRPTVGKTSDLEILQAVAGEGKTATRVFSLGFGYDVNTHLLDGISAKSRALSSYIPPEGDLEIIISSVFEAISYPVITDLRLRIEGVRTTEIYPMELPDLFAGRELLVLGAYEGEGKATVRLTGKTSEGDFEREIAVEFPEKTERASSYIRALWAHRKIGYLLDQIRRDGPSEELREEIIALATEFGVITPYTSYLAAPDEDYKLAMPEVIITDRVVGSRRVSEGRYRVDAFNLNMDEAGLRSSTGAEAVAGSMQIQQFYNMNNVYTLDRRAPARPESTVQNVQFVRGRNFQLDMANNAWVEQNITRPATNVQIAYLSDAHLQLVEQFPEWREALLLGSNVQLVLNGVWVEIGESGERERLPAALMR